MKQIVKLLAVVMLVGLLGQACASSSGYHKKPPSGGKFKCK
ncbi:hypothetical protein N8Z47_02335 [Salibacteraceae bacterium]|nr:hypothetical protein [Salibacteraceae bacterium]